MKKTNKRFTDLTAEMYKPPFVPHYKGMCEDMRKQHQIDIKENKKLTPGKKKK